MTWQLLSLAICETGSYQGTPSGVPLRRGPVELALAAAGGPTPAAEADFISAAWTASLKRCPDTNRSSAKLFW